MESRKRSSEAKEQLPQGSISKILLEERVKRGLPNNSESRCEQNQTTLLNPEIRGNNFENPTTSSQPSLSASCCSSISTIGSARLTESQTSGYTTESSYQTAIEGSTSSYLIQPYNPTTVHNYLREIHVGVESNATNNQIQEIHNDLRSLLYNEVALINEATEGRRSAIYIIAYTFM